MFGLGAATLLSAALTATAPLGDTELDGLRGGFVSAGGYTFDFGAVTRTLVDGRLALQTEITWSAEGARVTRMGGDGATVPALAAGLAPGDLGEAAFVTPDGRSAIIQRVTADGLANVVLNTASGRTIAQRTDVTLTLPGFQDVQGRIADAAAASRVALSIADTALAAAVRR